MEKVTLLVVDIVSFSFKRGLPHPTNEHGGGFIFDCRSITNPGRETEFKSLTGKDESVVKFIEQQDEAHTFYLHLRELTVVTIEKYLQRGFSYLSVAFGCTGGQHRSVYFAQRLANELRVRQDLIVNLTHRELGIYESDDSSCRPR